MGAIMCGICGFAGAKAFSNSERVLKEMLDAIIHRGPDEEGIQVFFSAGIGCRRLSIIDVDGSSQPISNEDESIFAVCNGEIYNFRSLRRELKLKGHEFKTNGDVETIVHAYEEWGDSCVKHFRGMFALAVYDERRNRLFLARDRIGIKPLFYSIHKGRIVFGSEIKALLASGTVTPDIDMRAVDLYLSLIYVPTPFTIYSSVRKLPPACCLVFEEGDASIDAYWHPPPEQRCIDVKAAQDELLNLLKESVDLHLQSDVPLAFFLSGGLDSSAIVALASQVSSTPPRTFSMGFEDRNYNELPYARSVAQKFGCDHHEIMVTADAAQVLPGIVSQFDEPFGDSSAVPTYYICSAAAGDMKVVVGGDGGDELFAGYEWTRRQRFIEYFNAVPCRPGRLLEMIACQWRGSAGIRGKLGRFAEDAAGDALAGYSRRVSCFTPRMKEHLYGPELRSYLGANPVEGIFSRIFGEFDDTVTAMNRSDFAFYLPEDDLCKVDRMTMLHSLEGRVPLLDHKVVDYALSLPMSVKLRGLESKYILKQSLKGLLPGVILKQRKQGFSIPVSAWMRDSLHTHLTRLAREKDSMTRRLFKEGSVSSIVERHLNHQNSDLGHALWALLVLEIWWRTSGGVRTAEDLSGISLKDI